MGGHRLRFGKNMPGRTPKFEEAKATAAASPKLSGAPNENIVQNHLNIALVNVF